MESCQLSTVPPMKMPYSIETKKKKSGKRYRYLVETHWEGTKTVKKRVERIGSTIEGSPPIAEIIGEHNAQALILLWNEKGRPPIPISQGITIRDLEKYLYQPRSLLTQEALDIILKGEA